MALGWIIFITFVASLTTASAQKSPCGKNEILDDCPISSPAEFCPKGAINDNLKLPIPIRCPRPRCKCRFNYRRAENGTCIETRNCPPFTCSGPNEYYEPCPPLCPSDDCVPERITGNCPINITITIVVECNPKCRCNDGFARLNGVCVPLKKCPNICPSNEIYTACVEKICRPQFCNNTDEEICNPKVPEKLCTRGCICKNKYFRNENGTCVPFDQCEDLCPIPYEEYVKSYVPLCPLLETCAAISKKFKCDKPESSGCTCKGGYMRLNLTTPCIFVCECPEMKGTQGC